MKFIQEYALLIAVATPVAVIVAIQVWLFMTGERGTLLLPSLRRFPSVDISAAVKALEATAATRHAAEQQLAKVARLVAADRRVTAERRGVPRGIVVAERIAEKAA